MQQTVSRSDETYPANEIEKTPADFGSQRFGVGQHAGNEITCHACFLVEEKAIELLSYLNFLDRHRLIN